MAEAADHSKELDIEKRTSKGAVVFISHDSRDAKLAEAFGLLLTTASSGMLRTFCSSDKSAGTGIEYGDEWYSRLMSSLENASDVVCLFTKRSLDRPWILYEAGVAKGKLRSRVLGVALGVALKEISVGPFYQFQNCDDSDDALTALVFQLCKRVEFLSPNEGFVKEQVRKFKSQVASATSTPHGTGAKASDEAQLVKLFEEIKILLRELPIRIRMEVVTAISPSTKPRLDSVESKVRDSLGITKLVRLITEMNEQQQLDPKAEAAIVESQLEKGIG